MSTDQAGTPEAPLDLTGKLLIAMPGMADPRFDRSVVLMCAHSPEGAMGLIVNKPTPELHFRALCDQLDVPAGPEAREVPVHFGGPVENGRGFVLHSRDFSSEIATLEFGDCYGVTTTLDVLEALGRGEGPEKVLLTLGYSGWGPGQLEAEIGQNGWLTGPAPEELVFSDANAGKWAAALRAAGVDPMILSGSAGRA